MNWVDAVINKVMTEEPRALVRPPYEEQRRIAESIMLNGQALCAATAAHYGFSYRDA